MQPMTCQPVARAFDPAIALPGGTALRPPLAPRQLGGLSGRPRCRIYPRADVWVLEFDAASGGWLDDRDDRRNRLTFLTLVAAIGYAERHGLDYRIEMPRAHPDGKRRIPASRRRRRPIPSWLRGHRHQPGRWTC